MMVVPLLSALVRAGRSELAGVLAPVVGGLFDNTGKFAIRQTEATYSFPSAEMSPAQPGNDLPSTCGCEVADHYLPAQINPFLSLPSGSFGPMDVCQPFIAALRPQRKGPADPAPPANFNRPSHP